MCGETDWIEQLRQGDLPNCARQALAQSGVVSIADPASTCTGCPLAAVYEGRGTLTARLEHSGEVYGVLNVSVPGDFVADAEEQSLLKGVARDIAFALYSIELEKERRRVEEALDLERRQFLSIFDSIDEIVYVSDPDTYEIIYVNRATRDVFGDVVGQKCYRALQGLESPCSFCTNDLIFGQNAGQPYIWEFQNSINSRWYRCMDRAIRWPDGRMVRYEMAVDINDRKQAEVALRESGARLQSIFRAAPTGIGLVSSDRVLLQVNDRICEMLGYSCEELVGRSARVLYPSDEDFEYVGREKYLQIRERGTGTVETRWRRKDGQVIEILLSSTPVDSSDPAAGVTFTALDITERKQAEREREWLLAQIQEQARLGQQVIDTVPEGVILLDAGERIIMANPVGGKNLAILSDVKVGGILTHLAGHPLEEFLPSPPKGLWHNVSTDGGSFQVVARPLEAGPVLEGWVLVTRDVTQQREFEQRAQQQERLASVGQLAAGIAHDFNNIMATIVLYAQMSAQAEGLPDRVRERMVTIDQQAQHATSLIRQILDFSRRAVLERHPLDLLLFLKEQVKLLERTLPENIEVEIVYGAGEYMINADPTRIQQMMTNLALNARDAMPEGGILRIALERIEIRPGESHPLPEMGRGIKNQEWVRVTVSDTGAGIPPDVLPYIYDPFFTTKAPGAGSGLGLSQVHGTVGQHEGHIDVQTQLNHGTTFTIYLPALPTHLAEALTLEISPLVNAEGQGEMILVVEDNAAARRALMESLELLNYRVLEAANGQEALAVLERHGDEIALVLSDVVMPGMGGISLLHVLRERGLEVGVVMLTGHPLEKELESLRSCGMIDWLAKPPDLERLAQVVARALER
ncbi:MAG: PAS domain S-box protein [Chloroflexota bacterium]|nr:PAS domain S-box protein [Chloroflexota bacterium]